MHPACPRFVTVVKIIQLLDNEVLAIVLSQLILKGFVFIDWWAFVFGFKIVGRSVYVTKMSAIRLVM